MANARASRTTKAQAKSSRTPASKTTRPSAPTTSVDVRIYDPTRTTYYRPHPFELRSMPLLSPLEAPLRSPSSASSPSPTRSGVQNAAQLQDADHLPFSSSPQVTSSAYTLFQGEENESPRREDAYCNAYEVTYSNQFDALWLTIEDDVDWYQVAPPHLCGPDNHPFCDDDACDNCASLSWSGELNLDIPTALAAPSTPKGACA